MRLISMLFHNWKDYNFPILSLKYDEKKELDDITPNSFFKITYY